MGYGFRAHRMGGPAVYAHDLMRELAARGHHVAYFFTGRHYPLTPRDRLHRWRRGRVAMREVVNSTLLWGGEYGTRTPAADLDHPPSERLFERTLEEQRPDVVHVQELIGLPTSLIDLARGRGIPVAMTLHDYFTLCPTLTLWDTEDRICMRPDVGEQCARCSAGAPASRRRFFLETAGFELRRAIGPQRARPLAERAIRLVGHPNAPPAAPDPAPGPLPPPAPPAAYQSRRDENVARLSRADLLIAQSHRAGEIYATLGVDPGRIRVIHSTIRHLERIRPRASAPPPPPVRFVAPNGCSSVPKGSDLVTGAMEELHRRGLAGSALRLTVLGPIAPAARERLGRIPGVELRGEYAPDELDRVLDGFHAGIVPSACEEVYGYVGLELLAKGLPVIGTARGGITDYVRDGETGWLVRDVTPAGLADTMAAAVADPRRMAEMSRAIVAARDSLTRSFDAHVDEIETVYRELRPRTAATGSAMRSASSQ